MSSCALIGLTNKQTFEEMYMNNQPLLNNPWKFNKQFSLTLDGKNFLVRQYIRGCLMQGTLECKLEVVK